MRSLMCQQAKGDVRSPAAPTVHFGTLVGRLLAGVVMVLGFGGMLSYLSAYLQGANCSAPC
ncbi:MAG: hypothetical protein GEU74_13745 [Nitriliruptorales bacterium]|nr:hypothetical protein [Nitriliruptorales bacterium]